MIKTYKLFDAVLELFFFCCYKQRSSREAAHSASVQLFYVKTGRFRAESPDILFSCVFVSADTIHIKLSLAASHSIGPSLGHFLLLYHQSVRSSWKPAGRNLPCVLAWSNSS